MAYQKITTYKQSRHDVIKSYTGTAAEKVSIPRWFMEHLPYFGPKLREKREYEERLDAEMGLIVSKINKWIEDIKLAALYMGQSHGILDTLLISFVEEINNDAPTLSEDFSDGLNEFYVNDLLKVINILRPEKSEKTQKLFDQLVAYLENMKKDLLAAQGVDLEEMVAGFELAAASYNKILSRKTLMYMGKEKQS